VDISLPPIAQTPLQFPDALIPAIRISSSKPNSEIRKWIYYADSPRYAAPAFVPIR
jgi:hypothetical protein